MGRALKMEEIVPRWGARSSKPGGAVKRSLVGSTPALFRHLSLCPEPSLEVFQRGMSGPVAPGLLCPRSVIRPSNRIPHGATQPYRPASRRLNTREAMRTPAEIPRSLDEACWDSSRKRRYRNLMRLRRSSIAEPRWLSAPDRGRRLPASVDSFYSSIRPRVQPFSQRQARSKRSAFMTLFQAATKSRTNLACASSCP
jgi:hypothetical protein